MTSGTGSSLDTDQQLKIELLHSLGWMFSFGHIQSRRDLEEPARLAAIPAVPNGTDTTLYNTSDTHEILSEVFKPFGIISETPWSYDAYTYRFEMKENFLREHLGGSPLIDKTATKPLLVAFLKIASDFDPRQTLKLTGWPSPALPTHQGEWPLPEHFQSVVCALERHGLCTSRAGRYLWTSAVAPYMEEAYLWFDGVPAAEVRQRALLQRWDTMPPKVRAMVATPDGSLDLRRLMIVWGHFWYDGAWHEKPENELNFQRNLLVGPASDVLDLVKLLQDRAGQPSADQKGSLLRNLSRFFSSLRRG